MNKKAADSTTTARIATTAPAARDQMGIGAIWLTLADTTMRLFIPSVGGTVVGIWLDRTIGSRPWFTIVGVIVGAAIAFGLVYLQIKTPSQKLMDTSNNGDTDS